MPPTDLRIHFESAPSDAERLLVINNVDNHNIAATGLAAFYPINLFLRSDNGETLGGLLGYLWGGWLHIQYLWVAETPRHQGHATRLMDRAESHAVTRGCTGATLETHSFQARPFYERRGYEVFAELADYPPGHSKFYLRKSLRAKDT